MAIKEICKSYKNLVYKWGPRDKHSPKQKEEDESPPGSSGSYLHHIVHQNNEEDDESYFTRSPSSLLSRNASRRSHTPSRRSKSAMRRPTTSSSLEIPTLSKTASRGSRGRSASTTRSRELGRTTSTTPIAFTQSSVAAKLKPLPVEMQLDCTLEELCFGAVKNIPIKKDVITDIGIIVQDEEILKINVKPGWKNGTKITFEGKGDEKPGYMPSDIVFSIREKRHRIFKRVGDNLELGMELPLAKALTTCSITVPLLGGEKITIRVNDVISPGFQKSIAGQGMPVIRQDGRRGDLVVKFDIVFPKSMSDEQRCDVRAILEDSFSEDQ